MHALCADSMTAELEQRISAQIAREEGRLRSFIRKRVANPGDVEDILQDVFSELVESYRMMKPVEQVGAWLFRVARNRITDLFRKRKAQALSALEGAEREVFVAHELEGRSFKELAAQSGLSVNTLLSRKRYAVLYLRQRLQSIYDDFI